MDKVKRFMKETISVLLIAGLITLVVKTYILENRIIPTSSMYPTIYAGDMVLVNKLIYRFSPLVRGDIIVFRPEKEVSADDLIKRIIALPGEKIEVIENQVFINDSPIEEIYLNEKPQYNLAVQVPENRIFVLGDNRNMSFDSHLWRDPFLDIESIKGKAFFRYWPLKRGGRL